MAGKGEALALELYRLAERGQVAAKLLERVQPAGTALIRGTATDPGGVDLARIRFGHGDSKELDLGANGDTFKLKHRYADPGKYTVRLKVVGAEGKQAKYERKANVKKHKRRRHHGVGH